MKYKCVLDEDCPQGLARVLETMGDEVIERVIGPHLHRWNFGPAEIFHQNNDLAYSTRGHLCVATLSMVSLTDDRCNDDFLKARDELERLCREKIEKYLPVGERMQLMVVIALDGPRKGSNLVEGDPAAVWVEGRCKHRPTKNHPVQLKRLIAQIRFLLSTAKRRGSTKQGGGTR